MPIKSNCEGLGYKEMLHKWWEEEYNNTVQNIQVKPDQKDTVLSLCHYTWDYNLSNKKRDTKIPWTYINFKKTSVLHNGHLIKDGSTSGEKEIVQDSVNVSSVLRQLSRAVHSISNNEVVSHTATRSPSVSSAKLERIALQDSGLYPICSKPITKVFETQEQSYKTSLRDCGLDTFHPSSSIFPSSSSSSGFKMMLNKTNHALNEKEEMVEDEYETNNNIMLQTLQTSTRSKSRNRRFRKKMSNLMQQLNRCRIEETKKSKCDLLKDQFLRNVRSRKESFKIKRRFEQPKLIQKKDIANINKKTESQDGLEYKSVQMQLETNNDTSSKEENYKLPHEPLAEESTCLITLTEDKDTDMASTKNTKNLIYFHKTKKKNRNKHKRNQHSKIEDVIKNIAKKRDIDVVTKALTDINLTEDVSSKIKNKPTQTHITPV